MRILFLAWLMWLPSAQALEFGLPEVVSAQGEPLEVRFAVTGLEPTTPEQLFPLLAPEAKFTEQGIDRSAALSVLTYSIETQAGEVDLVIRTTEPWSDSELTTLVEVFTPEGPTLLPVSVQVPTSDPVAQGMTETVLSVPNGATLWRLASSVQPDGLTVEQVMMALYDTNAQAFEFDNVNALERGSTLRVPTLEVMALETATESKARFDQHMQSPKANFPRSSRRVEGVIATVETVIPEVIDAGEATNALDATDASAVSADGSAVIQSETASVSDTPSNPLSDTTATAPEVERLIEKITALESKLEAVDQKLEAITALPAPQASAPAINPTPATEVASEPVSTPLEPGFEIDAAEILNAILNRVPTRAEFDAFRKTEVGQGTLILIGVLFFALLARRVYGQQPHVSTARPAADEVRPAAISSDPVEKPSHANVEVSPVTDGTLESLAEVAPSTEADALESAIERLKSRIEDPTRSHETDALYAEGADDDALMNAFSAEALNEHPEWGEDPDDEQEIATHQLELARDYLNKGMTQTAIELLERVAVSPDKASATQARTLLNAHRA